MRTRVGSLPHNEFEKSKVQDTTRSGTSLSRQVKLQKLKQVKNKTRVLFNADNSRIYGLLLTQCLSGLLSTQ